MRKVLFLALAIAALAIPSTAFAMTSWSTASSTVFVTGAYQYAGFVHTVKKPVALRLHVTTEDSSMLDEAQSYFQATCVNAAGAKRTVTGDWTLLPNGVSNRTIPMPYLHPVSCTVGVAFGDGSEDSDNVTVVLQKRLAS